LPPPSIEKLPLRLLPPPTISDSHANDAVDDWICTPGVRPTANIQLRLRIGSAFSSPCPMLAPICFEVTSSSGDSPVTVTFSSTPPTASLMSSVVVLPICRMTSGRSYFLKPCRSAVTR
jgi:hypothetical protein